MEAHAKEDMTEIDGSVLEGGGQIVRTAVALSAITGKPVRIFNIRKKRKNPGLREQHLQAINAAAMLCNAKHNAKLYASEFEFWPNKLEAENITLKIGTAGSTALVLSVAMAIAAFHDRPVKLRVVGGATWNKFAPSIAYMQRVLLPLLSYVGYHPRIEIKRDGFYPKGGAIVTLVTEPWKNRKRLEMQDFSTPCEFEIVSIASKELASRKVAERQAKAARHVLAKELSDSVKARVEQAYVDSICPGTGVLVVARGKAVVVGSDVPGEKRVAAEQVGEEAALQLCHEIKARACVDKHAADQLMLYLAFVGGKIKTSEITLHAKTNAYVIEKFLPVSFTLDEGNKTIAVDQAVKLEEITR